ncbi:dynein light chain tctex1, putative [Perkinsus marinus ATCC 50983]|uniref:Dynein light chain tctex1, putative n=1 Tax=Perkinsus marinus (strain ATCC 50983 / TXsc) TaxID=423536 RepID=C5LTX5_PERM5|nr:dynein light chain tctex1, putative [Perkinsus marinus ATCC 50983]EEQ99773.1 dynein light chain tctex1, putative [Perkinsus marinus ATCC 50983]|eukprot:XP_002767056.1 dynein light chain tctex1, putative [Perkinsus marinus ATCC 50983]
MVQEITSFVGMEDVTTDLILQVLKATIKTDDEYDAKKAQEWADQIGLKIVSKLKEASDNFKYVVSVTIQEKGAG